MKHREGYGKSEADLCGGSSQLRAKAITKPLDSTSAAKTLTKGALGTAGVHLLSIALTLISGILLARLQGPENYGLYAFVISLITIVTIPVKSGMPTLLVREIAKNCHEKNWGGIKGILNSANAFGLLYSAAVGIVASIVILWFWTGGDDAKAVSFLWALILVPLFALEAVRTGTLRGLQWVISSQIPEKIIRPLIMIVGLALVAMSGQTIDTAGGIQIYVIAAFIAFGFGVIFLIKALPKAVRVSEPEYDLRRWATSLVPLSVFTGLTMLDSQISLLLLGIIGTAEETGIFKVATTGASLVSFGLMAVNMGLAPRVATLYRAGEMDRLQKIVTLSTRLVAGVSIPVALILVIFGRELIILGFGEGYSDAELPLIILTLGQMANAFAGSVALLLNMTGHEKLTIPAILIALTANIVFAVLLIPPFGVVGAAVASMTSLLVWNLMLVFSVKKNIGIKSYLQF